MLKNYLLITFRNLARHRIYAFINIFGLAIGMAACIVIFLFITDELSFDASHKQKDRIYRLDEVQSFEGMSPQNVALSMPGMGPNLLNDFPEIENYTRYWNRGEQMYEIGNLQMMVDNTVMVDSTFLKIFDFPLLQGDRNTALDEPHSLVVSEETARKLFGSTDVVGKQLILNNENFQIKGILANVPENSHLQFDVLISISTVTRENPEFNNRWGSNFMVTYLLLEENTDIKALETKFPAFLQKYMGEDVTKYYTLFLQQLADVHLGSMDIEHDYQNYRKFDGTYIKVFSILAFFVLVIASINFMNLSVARSSTRSKEVGIRKSVGAERGQIIVQFLGESVVLTFIALMLALLIALAFIPYLNAMAERTLSITTIFENRVPLLTFIIVTLLVGIVSGFYPAFFISSFQPAKVLKGRLEGLGRKSVLRNALVVTQFAIAIGLIVGTVLALQQLNYMKNKDIGFNKDQVMLVDMSREANEKFELLRTELLERPHIKGVTASSQRLGNNLHQTGGKVKADTTLRNLSVSQVNVDYDFLEVYGIQLIEGRNFSRDFSTDAGFAFIINESLVKELGLENPIGAQFGFGWYDNDTLGTIIGVTSDFNFNSLHHQVNTLCMHIHPEWGYSELSIKVDAAGINESIEEVRAVWDEIITDRPFDYSFLDEHFEGLYRADQQMSRVVSIIAGLAIIIACLGLFGLASITTQQRIKEIGIRKILGATLPQLFVTLSKNFAFLIMIAFLVAVPATYLLMQEWLAGFAFRIPINPWVFVFSGAIALSVALVTVSYQTIRAATINPVETLRNE